jgi:phosphotriesterase-related protein
LTVSFSYPNIPFSLSLSNFLPFGNQKPKGSLAMPIPHLQGKVQTVLGIIAPGDLGITLPHEHIVSDGSAWFVEPEEATEKAMARAKVSLNTLWWIRYHWFQNLDDMLMLDEPEAIEELQHFKLAGGGSVVEMSNHGLGRDPLALARISRITGLNIVMGSGYYFAASMPKGFESKTEEEITKEIVGDITIGVGKTGIKAGYIGEIGTSWPIDPREVKSLRAAVNAQKITGANLNVHPGQAEEAAFRCLEILAEAGADLSRTTMDHIDRAVRIRENRFKLLEKGLILEYDLFGREGYYPLQQRHIDLPTDHQRVNEVIEIIKAGYIKQVLISQDIWNKHQRRRYGGWGYDHILRNTVPVMRAKGLTEEQIHTLLVENPKRVYTFI